MVQRVVHSWYIAGCIHGTARWAFTVQRGNSTWCIHVSFVVKVGGSNKRTKDRINQSGICWNAGCDGDIITFNQVAESLWNSTLHRSLGAARVAQLSIQRWREHGITVSDHDDVPPGIRVLLGAEYSNKFLHEKISAQQGSGMAHRFWLGIVWPKECTNNGKCGVGERKPSTTV